MLCFRQYLKGTTSATQSLFLTNEISEFKDMRTYSSTYESYTESIHHLAHRPLLRCYPLHDERLNISTGKDRSLLDEVAELAHIGIRYSRLFPPLLE